MKCSDLPCNFDDKFPQCVRNSISYVKFYPRSKKVFDHNSNYIGQGELVNGKLKITKPQIEPK